ncbi:hypothetical protein GCM10027404_05810 [Arthrobacter tumbae]|uniref:HNH endonuclease signature motif containing protein n=1 Tax=Arthrobacter tumbae TaxID=163874 RepID=UPI0019591F57|nr:HNH endonuclease signature motif containing protein [Arthrobacter tumbae]MBM7779976.1 hypothetical protein [Arthrobacter tumbae]
MSSEEQFPHSAGRRGDGARLSLTSVWEGSAEPAPAGPYGHVHLPPTGGFDLPTAVDALVLVNELQCWAEAQKAKLVDRIREHYLVEAHLEQDTDDDGITVAEQSSSWAAEEVGTALRLPSSTSRTLVEQSQLLLEEYSRTFIGLESGKLSWRHAATIVEECVGVPADSVVRFEQDLVEVAEQSTVAKLTRRARGLREILHPEAAPVRKTRAAAERRVIVEPGTDGMAWLSAYLPAEQACGIYNRIDAGARGLQAPEEGRTLGQLRADVFTDLLTHTCTGDISTGTGFRGIGATVHITVPALTLLDQMPGGGGERGAGGRGADRGSTGFMAGARAGNAEKGRVAGDGWNPMHGEDADEHGITDGYGPADGDSNADSGARLGRPGYAVLEGYGPIDPETAARLAGHAPSFTRILTHPETGAALSIGRASYRPPKHLQDWVRARDKTCRHPGCNRTAKATEIDHTIPWHKGGRTDHHNLSCLCAKHHMLKTNEHWDYKQPEPGTIIAISPAGKTYTTRPPPF